MSEHAVKDASSVDPLTISPFCNTTSAPDGNGESSQILQAATTSGASSSEDLNEQCPSFYSTSAPGPTPVLASMHVDHILIHSLSGDRTEVARHVVQIIRSAADDNPSLGVQRASCTHGSFCLQRDREIDDDDVEARSFSARSSISTNRPSVTTSTRTAL